MTIAETATPIMSAVEALASKCGTCVFAKKTDPTNLASEQLACRRYPPTAVPLFMGEKLRGAQGLYPPVQRTTPACGEYQPRIAQ